jgi:hypothetical protein
MADKLPKSAKRPQPKGGSRKGIPNKVTADVKAMILQALSDAGGAAYLLEQANGNPNAFLTLVGKVLPLTVSGDKDNPLEAVVRFRLAPLE